MLPEIGGSALYIQDCTHQQIVSQLPKLAPGAKVLDACAAPGGKSSAILALQPGLQLLAIDHNAQKIPRLQANLKAHPQATVLKANALETETWWDNTPFDAIICDVPCSGTAVIQKHPEIKYLQSPENIQTLQATQAQLLEKLWPLLKENGFLLYSTCSILEEENDENINRFLHQHASQARRINTQTIYPETLHAGGYFALIQKTSKGLSTNLSTGA